MVAHRDAAETTASRFAHRASWPPREAATTPPWAAGGPRLVSNQLSRILLMTES
jgi:hypothetical protein